MSKGKGKRVGRYLLLDNFPSPLERQAESISQRQKQREKNERTTGVCRLNGNQCSRYKSPSLASHLKLKQNIQIFCYHSNESSVMGHTVINFNSCQQKQKGGKKNLSGGRKSVCKPNMEQVRFFLVFNCDVGKKSIRVLQQLESPVRSPGSKQTLH